MNIHDSKRLTPLGRAANEEIRHIVAKVPLADENYDAWEKQLFAWREKYKELLEGQPCAFDSEKYNEAYTRRYGFHPDDKRFKEVETGKEYSMSDLKREGLNPSEIKRCANDTKKAYKGSTWAWLKER